MIRALALLLGLLIAPAMLLAQEALQPILRTELEQNDAIPGQPVILRLTLLVPTWLPKPPVFPSFETANVIVRLPERASGPASERIDGETWSGVTRAYRLYPMIAGRFSIPAQPVTVTFADPDTRAPVTVELLTDAFSFTGTVPQGAEGLDPFIAATALTLVQNIEGGTGPLEPGGAIIRTVKVRLQGVSPIFLPPLIPPLDTEGIAAYAKEPVVTETQDRGSLSGERVESVTYVAEAGGRYAAPPVRLQWFNLEENRIETVEAEGFEIAVNGPPPAPPPTFEWREMLPLAVAAITIAAVAGLMARRFRPRLTVWRQRRREVRRASATFAFDQAIKALRQHDFNGSLRAIDLWKSRLPPGVTGAQDGLSAALAQLGASFYSRDRSPPFDGQWTTTIAALRSARRNSLAAPAADRALPPLNPGIVR